MINRGMKLSKNLIKKKYEEQLNSAKTNLKMYASVVAGLFILGIGAFFVNFILGVGCWISMWFFAPYMNKYKKEVSDIEIKILELKDKTN